MESGSNDTNQGEHLKRNSKTEVDSKKRKFDNDSGFLTEMFQNQGNKPVKEYCAGWDFVFVSGSPIFVNFSSTGNYKF